MTQAVHGRLARSLSWEHERIAIVQDAETGLQGVIAVHSTVLGPALGGLRVRRYEHGLPEALDDALRLSHAMTFKASAAGLDLGGGKAVIVDDGRDDLREARLAAFAREIERLDGAYITAEDVGTTTADMDFLALHTEHVVGRTPSGGIGGDPSPDTARTVLGSMRAALRALGEPDDLAGLAVGIVGLGKVGGQLARWLLEHGAHVVAFDAVSERAEAPGVECAGSVREVLERRLDIVAPCATGGMIDEAAVARLRCRIVCGAANNPLTGDDAAAALHARGIVYVPDFLANCGGLIHVDAERRADADPERLAAALTAAEERVEQVVAEALRDGRTPANIAADHARRRIEMARWGAAARL